MQSSKYKAELLFFRPILGTFPCRMTKQSNDIESQSETIRDDHETALPEERGACYNRGAIPTTEAKSMPKGSGKKRARLTAILAAVAFAFTVFIFAPMEQYLLSQNESEIWFDLSDLLPALLPAFVLCAALCSFLVKVRYVRREAQSSFV